MVRQGGSCEADTYKREGDMPFFAWNSTLEVGIKLVDTQHKVLVDLINRLHDAMKEGRGKEVLGPILAELVTYTNTHFKAEEELMVKSKYPDFAAHKKIHDDLKQQVQDLQKKFESGNTLMTIDVMTFLKDWLSKHIQGIDKKYVPQMKQQGIS
jgi:hemerythrin